MYLKDQKDVEIEEAVLEERKKDRYRMHRMKMRIILLKAPAESQRTNTTMQTWSTE
jgi:hypothetical protein